LFSQGHRLQKNRPALAEFTASLKSEYTKWAKVLEDAGIKPE
jgi:hypothetical protein